MAISQLYPNQRPTLNLNFARSKTLDPSITFTRNSTATYVGSDGLIKTAAAGEARFDHNTNGDSLGLLIEEQRTNYLCKFAIPQYNGGNSATYSTYSDSKFGTADNAHSWTWASAQTNVELGWSNPGNISTTGNGIQYTLSFWGKANQDYILRGNLIDERRQGLNFSFSLTTEWKYFTISTPAGINDDGSGTVYFRWVRGNVAIPAGLKIDLARVNLERGGFPTSFIPTDPSAPNTTVTRVADTAEITGTNFSSWYNQSEGTFVFSAYHIGGNYDELRCGAGSSSNNQIVFGGPGYAYFVTTSGAQVCRFGTGFTKPTGQIYKATGAYKQQNFGFALDGVSATPDTTGNAPVGIDFLEFFKNSTNSNIERTGYLLNFSYYPTRLTDSQLEELTS